MRNNPDFSDLGYGRQFGGGQQFGQLGVAERSGVLSRVMGLLGFAFLFTCAGVLVGSRLGPGTFLLSIVGTFGCLIGLMFAREKTPINLILLYAFATFEGMLLGPILDSFISQGMGGIVLNAAAGTAGITLLAGMYGYTTKRDLTGLGNMLFIGLVGVIVASVIGIFLHLTALQLVISVAAVAIFSGFIVYDMSRIAKTRVATEGMAIMFAVSIYLDMLNIFLSLLNILSIVSGGGGSRRNN